MGFYIFKTYPTYLNSAEPGSRQRGLLASGQAGNDSILSGDLVVVGPGDITPYLRLQFCRKVARLEEMHRFSWYTFYWQAFPLGQAGNLPTLSRDLMVGDPDNVIPHLWLQLQRGSSNEDEKTFVVHEATIMRVITKMAM